MRVPRVKIRYGIIAIQKTLGFEANTIIIKCNILRIALLCCHLNRE
jgi:hypothetical protein